MSVGICKTIVGLTLKIVVLNAQRSTVYVRKNSDPFEAPFYIFSSSINGPPESIQLSKARPMFSSDRIQVIPSILDQGGVLQNLP